MIQKSFDSQFADLKERYNKLIEYCPFVDSDVFDYIKNLYSDCISTVEYWQSFSDFNLIGNMLRVNEWILNLQKTYNL